MATGYSSLMAGKGALFGHFFATLSKRRAIKLYLKRLSGALRDDYGHVGPYTPAQVEATLRRRRFPLGQAAYALAIFCDGGDPQLLIELQKQSKSLAALRKEVADAHFGGDYGFSPSDVSSYSADYGAHGHNSFGGHGGDHGGGHSGGDGGGHSGH